TASRVRPLKLIGSHYEKSPGRCGRMGLRRQKPLLPSAVPLATDEKHGKGLPARVVLAVSATRAGSPRRLNAQEEGIGGDTTENYLTNHLFTIPL
ncbi:hypothetical protein ACM9HB_35170, partial [Streptomyces sp. JAC128]|uniref:hypothetical protein n=1 Tax=Streptomyces sp. JAC128 TaxID=3418412 RepID=UPI003D812A83